MAYIGSSLYRFLQRVHVHRLLVRFYNSLLKRIPYNVKYGVHVFLCRGGYPYRKLTPGAHALVVGAARDLLHAGRSRCITIARLVGPCGKVIVLEASYENCQAVEAYAQRYELHNIILKNIGAWQEPGTLTFIADSRHPAASRLLNTQFGDAPPELHRTSIRVDTIENILSELDFDEAIRLASVTVNGAELEVLIGMGSRIHQFEYISVARAWANEDVKIFLANAGYCALSHDDRGVTYARQMTTRH